MEIKFYQHDIELILSAHAKKLGLKLYDSDDKCPLWVSEVEEDGSISFYGEAKIDLP